MYRKGMSHPCLAAVRRRLNVFPVSHEFDDLLAQRIRGIQLVHGIPVTGLLDAETAEAAGVADVVESPWTL